MSRTEPGHANVPPVVLSFAERDVACAESVIACIRDVFAPTARRSEQSNTEAADILAQLPGEPDDIHRYLLGQKKARGKWTPMYSDLEHALQLVRDHSRLYTRRSCWCLAHAWREFVPRVDEAFENMSPGPSGTYTVTSGDRVYADLDAVPALRKVLEYAGFSSWGGKVPASVTITIDADGRFEATIARSSRDRRTRTWAFARLPDDLAALANRVRYRPEGSVRAAGSWVRTWPPAMLEVFPKFVSRSLGMFGIARDMLDADIGTLPPAARTIAARLAEGWDIERDGVDHLVALARTWGSEYPEPTLAVLDAWLEALPHGFDQEVAAGELGLLVRAGACRLDERASLVAQRLLEDWDGTAAELVATATAVAVEPDRPRH